MRFRHCSRPLPASLHNQAERGLAPREVFFLQYPRMHPTHLAELEDLKRTLTEVFRRFPEIEAVFLFGSTAEGTARAGSDLDLAIVPRRAFGSRRLDLLAALAEAGFDAVDVVSLDTEDVVLRFEAVRPNRLVYARESFDRGGYYSRALREYLDFLPFLEVQRAAFKRRLAGA